MKKRKIVAASLTAMLALAVLGGCSGKDKGKEPGKDAGGGKDELLTVEVYSAAANYQGTQPGWFGKIIKDKFNIELNIIAPNVSGDAQSLYQTRSASGNLGDIVILDNKDFSDVVSAGLIADISAELPNYKNLMKYDEQIKAFNAQLPIKEGELFGIPNTMNSNGPTGFIDNVVGIAARLPWDYYSELGKPKMKNSDDLLTVLKDMMEKFPTGADGAKAYPFSLWKDWDNPNNNAGIENVNQLTRMYGQQVNGSILLGADNSITAVTDKEGSYHKMLKFLNKANQMGLVDPDSGTQKWDDITKKIKNKQIYMLWYNWQRGFYNTPERGEKDDIYIAIPIDDQVVFQQANPYFGDGRAWSVGSKVTGEKKDRIMEFLDWFVSPEGLRLQHSGPADFMYTVNPDGTYTQTKEGMYRFSVDTQMPEELGGGIFTDGNNQINSNIVGAEDIDPDTKETYTSDYWASFLKLNETKATKEWSETFGAKNEVEYFKNHGQMEVIPNVNVILAEDSTDMALIRSQCGNIVNDSSWKLIYAADDAAFEKGWDDMKSELDGLGWEKLVAFDTEKYQTVVNAREAAKK